MKIKKKELIIGIVAIVLIAAIGIAYGISKAVQLISQRKSRRYQRKKIKRK